MFEGCDGRVWDASILQSSDCLLPSFVCCLSCLLNMQLCRGLLIVVKSAEVGGGGCLVDRGEASLQEVLWEMACLDHYMNTRFGCDESSPSVPELRCLVLSGLASTERCLCLSSVRPRKAVQETGAQPRHRFLLLAVPEGL